ncbi:hypothetical protein ACQPYK_36880 [Streptosporangium sp. CA-135522]|uniref:hypothetical protein n=1 Tax=Streptosporangium sp. CA-135522 TaxID=3240072 RepID=UPI003D8A5742
MLKSTKTIFLAATLATGAFMANPAYAVASAYTPEGVCGTGFARVSDSSRPVKTPSGTVFGYVYLLYNRTTGFNCVTTIKSSFVGSSTYTSARLETQTKRIKDEPAQTAVKQDGKGYKYYAGPVTLYAKGYCVKYWGVIQGGGQQASGGRNAWGNCG